ncbi:putative cupin superfamily sugar epimerase [Sporosarcina luteola]|nr:putative cupin superfamily sugar epimerase [Sporosarcina luteola]
MKQDARYFIEQLRMEPHPEGGYYASTFHSKEEMDRQGKRRKLYTSIYFLLKPGEVSHFHRLQSDEVWYYHAGSPLLIHTIDPDGTYSEIKLGLDVHAGEQPQAVVPKGTIFGSSMVQEGSFSLVGCMVAPGFDFEDFELFTREELLGQYPQHETIITRLTRS